MDQPFRYYLRVRYGECDAQKVVFNPRYGDYIDIATIEFFRSLGFGQQIASGELDYQLVKLTIEWKAPAHFDEVLEVSVMPKHLGNTSFTIATEFRLAGQSSVIATGETVYVVVDRTLKKQPIPCEFRAALQEGGKGKLMDHAGLSSKCPP